MRQYRHVFFWLSHSMPERVRRTDLGYPSAYADNGAGGMTFSFFDSSRACASA